MWKAAQNLVIQWIVFGQVCRPMEMWPWPMGFIDCGGGGRDIWGRFQVLQFHRRHLGEKPLCHPIKSRNPNRPTTYSTSIKSSMMPRIRDMGHDSRRVHSARDKRGHDSHQSMVPLQGRKEGKERVYRWGIFHRTARAYLPNWSTTLPRFGGLLPHLDIPPFRILIKLPSLYF